jgi:hypothetical protein
MMMLSNESRNMKRTAYHIEQPRGKVVSAFAPEPASMTTGRERKAWRKNSNQKSCFVSSKQQRVRVRVRG